MTRFVASSRRVGVCLIWNLQITTRIEKLIYGLDQNYVNPIECAPFSLLLPPADNFSRVTQKVVAGVYNGITTMELDVRNLVSFAL